MKIDHLLQVHAVDMVGTEDGDDVEVTILYQVNILVNGVCRAPVPAASRAFLRGNRENEVITRMELNRQLSCRCSVNDWGLN